MNNLCFILPGVGYTADKPLLYYARKIAIAHGYTAIAADYSDPATGAVPSVDRNTSLNPRADFLRIACTIFPRVAAQIEPHISGQECRVLFICKSIGTVIAARVAACLNITDAYYIFYTPLEEAFTNTTERKNLVIAQHHAIAFHGTKDPWVDTEQLTKLCGATAAPLYITQGANHSLEQGDVLSDIETLQCAMQETYSFINSIRI